MSTFPVFILLFTNIISQSSSSSSTAPPVQYVSGDVYNYEINNGSTVSCDSTSDCHIWCDAIDSSNSNCIGNTFIFNNIWESGNSPYHELTCLYSSCRDITILSNTTSLSLTFDTDTAVGPAAIKVFAFIIIKPSESQDIPEVNIACLGIKNIYIQRLQTKCPYPNPKGMYP